ncbi:MAG: bi-domain-containing oxidoreductase [candidate division WOR-3 bacterium]
MKQIIQNYKTGELKVEEVPVPVVQPGMVLVQNAFSLISAGTERSSVELARKNLLQKAKSRPEDLKKVINLAKKQGIMQAYKTAMERLETPTPLGYSCAGIVLEVGDGVDDFMPGDKVACAGAGYASHSEVVLVPENLCVKVPDGVPLEWASFTTLGAIALQGIRQADVRIGETVAVIGLGLLGQLTVQILKASGCRVIGLDIDDNKVNLSKILGADQSFNIKISDFGFRISDFTNGFGVDAVIITAATESNEPFLLAPEIARDRAKVVLVGVAKLDFPREPYYRKELSVILSRSYGPGRYDPQYEESGIDYPIGYVRWTEKRNMEAVLQLMAAKKLNIEPLISHKFKIEDAHKAYDLILGKTNEKFLGVLFEYDIGKRYDEKVVFPVSPTPRYTDTHVGTEAPKHRSTEAPKHRSTEAPIMIGFIGAGNFARTSLLPNLKADGVELVGIADIQGALAKSVAQKYGFKYYTSDYKELFNDKKINTIFIATRHNLHAQLIIESLKAGKNTFCEKPLCLNKDELNEIIKIFNNQVSSIVHPESIFMLGFNRRFAPLTIKAKEFLGDKIGPYNIHYRVNAGELPKNHWLLDPQIGGGRIIGEVCHFVDFISYFVQSPLKNIYAHTIGDSKDDVVAILTYKDGSTGTISYFSTGDKDFPKERIEIFGDGKVCVIDDFRALIFSLGGKTKKIKQAQDKGHRNEIIAFFDAIENCKPSPIPFSEIVEATIATFAINYSLKTGVPVDVQTICDK